MSTSVILSNIKQNIKTNHIIIKKLCHDEKFCNIIKFGEEIIISSKKIRLTYEYCYSPEMMLTL